MATYDAGDVFDQSLARGFVELWGLPSKMAAVRDSRVSGHERPGAGYQGSTGG
jgi:argininosuccinate synthase